MGVGFFWGDENVLTLAGSGAHTCNPSSQEAELGGSLNSRPARSTWRVPSQSGYKARPCLKNKSCEYIRPLK
jgi:hypothetical protein